MTDTTAILLVAGGIIAVLGWLIVNLFGRIATINAAHTRCADALGTTQRKLSAIRDIVGPTEGLRRGRMGQIIAVLDGDV